MPTEDAEFGTVVVADRAVKNAATPKHEQTANVNPATNMSPRLCMARGVAFRVS